MDSLPEENKKALIEKALLERAQNQRRAKTLQDGDLRIITGIQQQENAELIENLRELNAPDEKNEEEEDTDNEENE